MTAYIDIVGAVAVGRLELGDSELRAIGKFTKENVVSRFWSHKGPDWAEAGKTLWMKVRHPRPT